MARKVLLSRRQLAWKALPFVANLPSLALSTASRRPHQRVRRPASGGPRGRERLHALLRAIGRSSTSISSCVLVGTHCSIGKGPNAKVVANIAPQAVEPFRL